MELTYSACCETGLKRVINQDRIAILQREERALFLVADGMGGHSEGERASETLRAGFTDWWSRAPQQLEFCSAVSALKAVMCDCNSEIRLRTMPGQICGSTLTLLWLQEGNYALLHVGDSRCYQVTATFLRVPRVTRLTVDDVSNQDANAGKLLRAVGVTAECQCSLQTGPILPKTMFALCSDGVYKYCEEKILHQSLIRCFRGADLELEKDRIMRHIFNCGAGDNFSLVFVRSLAE